VHPTKNFPQVSLLVLGGISIVAAFFPLDVVISALITTRVLVQFMAQILALPLLHRLPQRDRPYRMWLYPVPAIIAFVGWSYIFLTSGWKYVALGLLTLAAGTLIYFFRAYSTRTWPFPLIPERDSSV
jgi:amino acid transporter